MERVVRAFPILRGKEKRAREIAAEIMGVRAAEATEFFRRHGVTHESWHLQETAAGLWLIGVTEVGSSSAKAAGEGYARSHASFDTWLKDQIRDTTGIDPESTPLGPAT